MRRTLLLVAIFLLALVAARGVLAATQRKGSATLTGTVLGPDTGRGACERVVPILQRQRAARRAHGLARAIYDHEAAGRQLRHSRIGQGSLF